MANEIYEIANKVAQRLYFGSAAHHPHLASFWEMIGIPFLAEEQRESALEEFDRKLQLDKLIVDETGRFPLYSMPNLQTMANVVANVTPEQIRANPKQYIKAAIDNMKEYEEMTLKMLGDLKEKTKEFKDSKFPRLLAKLVQNVQRELDQIKADKEALERLEYEKEKILKGEHRMRGHDMRGRGRYGMDRYDDYEDRRRGRMMDDYDDRRYMDDRYDDDRYDDRRYSDDDRYDDLLPFMDDRERQHMDRYDDDLDDARRGRRRRVRVSGYSRRYPR